MGSGRNKRTWNTNNRAYGLGSLSSRGAAHTRERKMTDIRDLAIWHDPANEPLSALIRRALEGRKE